MSLNSDASVYSQRISGRTATSDYGPLPFEGLQPDSKRICGLSEDVFNILKIGCGMLTWWMLNIGYNVYNKRVLNEADLPWIAALSQLMIGIPINLVMWGFKFRPRPQLSRQEVIKLLPVAVCHLLTHVGAVISLGAGAVSFSHIVKASEPVFTSIFAGIMLGTFFEWPVYASLIPIIGGVAYASVSDNIGYTDLGFAAAMMSNIFSALRGTIGKKIWKKDTFSPEQNMTASNVCAVMTLLAAFLLTPLALFFELPFFHYEWNSKEVPTGQLIFEVILSMFFYNYYNEMAFLILDWVHPVTHAVGNTMKRVFVIISAVVMFNTPMDTTGIIGSSIAIVGALIYSVASKKFNKTYRCECVPSHLPPREQV
jgi:solute carrier family 35 protein E1